MPGRIGLADLSPTVACGRYPAKAVVGQPITVSATVFREGHESVGASVRWRPPGTSDDDRLIPMRREADWSTRYQATVVPDRQGLWSYAVQAWSDPLATWRHAVQTKAAAGWPAADLANDLEIGARLELITTSDPVQVWVDRRLAEFGSWYEFFPRSCGAQVDGDGRPVKHGTFADAVDQLDRAAAMGFDIVYLPPIHPIGEVNRKGRNNSVVAEAGDVGSPWAVGSALGGHDAVHPELGSIADFDAFLAAARERDLEVALDLALQCAPDHPWVTEHPEWFTLLPDGTIAYAENPPKRYQDIYPLNFDNDPDGLYAEVLRVVRFWIDRGVRVFRVDNPHTKPINFWAWLIGTVHDEHPDVIFLAEAFTIPAMMAELGRLGFSQSYTYFIWRTRKAELIDYGTELLASSDYFRPNFFVNTPDILHESLQTGGPGMFAIRAILAATMAPSWGVYSGYELHEDQPLAPGSEEYLDSEKYQLRPRDFDGALAGGTSLQPLITTLNRVRRRHPALQQLKGLWFHGVSNDNLLCYSRRDETSGDVVIVVVCLDSRSQQWGETDLWMPALGLDFAEVVTVTDELSGEVYQWGQRNAVGLDPHWRPAHVLTIKNFQQKTER